MRQRLRIVSQCERIKDESARLGLPSFKILGASWAIYRTLCDHLGLQPATAGGLTGLRGHLPGGAPGLIAATDGNHGRAVARIARGLRLDCQIFVPADMAAARIAAIESEGARVAVLDGDYDDAVAHSARVADDHHLVISDTSWFGNEVVPRSVIDGYTTIGHEVDAELRRREAGTPQLVAVQIGVGALAAAMVRHFRPQGATILGVEPTCADCVLASVEAGRLTSTSGPHDSIMAGLNCGRPSLIAWPVVSRGIDFFAAVDDDAARAAMRLMASAGVVSGASGAAGLAGLMEHRHEFKLAPDTTVLVLSTEGATDPQNYQEVVGRSPKDVARAHATGGR